MELAGKYYPRRTFIRYKAKHQLRIELDTYSDCEPLDEELFQELTKTLFQSKTNQELYQEYHSREQSAEIEHRIADELVCTYKQIKLRQSDPTVQRLNALL